MKPLSIKLKNPTPLRIDMRPFTPDTLRGKSLHDIQFIPVYLGNQSFEAGELFKISGDDTQQILISPESGKLDYIGASMSAGEIIVEGNAGMRAGEQLQGGSVNIKGNTGVYSGAGMTAGRLLIEGNSENFLGAALPGEKQGMSGGEIIIQGNSGDRTGDRLRRGIIIVHGNNGDYCGSRMTAGTIAVAGQCGKLTGINMKRGTLLMTREPESIPVTFGDNGQQTLPFMTLLLRELRMLSNAFDSAQIGQPVHRYLGDRANSGLGEILILPKNT